MADTGRVKLYVFSSDYKTRDSNQIEVLANKSMNTCAQMYTFITVQSSRKKFTFNRSFFSTKKMDLYDEKNLIK